MRLETRTPRRADSSSAECRLRNASIVAWVTLTGLVEPYTLARMSRIPAASTTARTEPPAMTPVPCEAGLSMTLLALNWVRTSCGIVVPTIGIRISFFFASSTPLRIASGNSPALPRPAPTCPAPSPTTTTALKLKRRPPLTTFATRLIWTTRSSSASLLGSIRANLGSFRSELEAGFAGGIGERLHTPVVPEPGSIEDHAVDPRGLGALGDEFADLGRLLRLGRLRALELLLDGRRGGERPAGRVVD